jgi:hypothetical protein
MIQLKVYSNLQSAFIFQLIFGLLCLLGILLVGRVMFVLFALMSFRPLTLSQRTVQDPAKFWRFQYWILIISVATTAITLVILCVFLQLFGNLEISLGKDPHIWGPALFSYFLVIHGMVGFIEADQ